MSTIYTSQQRPKVSTSNSWNTAMNGNNLRTGTWESTLGYNVVVVVISADADSKQGGVRVQFHTATAPTDAGTASSTTYTLDTYTAGTGYVRAFGVQGPYFRLEYENGAAPTAGTVAAGATATPTATTADVRGTYLPNAACDGVKALQLVVMLNELSVGGAQFTA